MRTGAVGPAYRFQLKQPEIDSELQHLSAITRLNHSCLGHTDVEIPALKCVINIQMHGPMPVVDE